jgi:GNAT superfamily N-acetyltransferase
MMRWSLGAHGDVEERFVRCFEYFLEGVIPAGTVWEAGRALGATAWIAPGEMDVWRDAQMTETRMRQLTEDGGLRYDAFWAWVDSRAPEEPLWFLDSVGVAGQARGRGIGGALIRFGLERARADDVDAFWRPAIPETFPSTSTSASGSSTLRTRRTADLGSGSCGGLRRYWPRDDSHRPRL